MIEAICACGWKWVVAERDARGERDCVECGRRLAIASAEELAEGAGLGDFDAVLEVIGGPDRAGNLIYLGGVAEISIGKLEGATIRLGAGKMVSRTHCRLVRVDFGPSRWIVRDNKSTNGLFVNGERVAEKELESGDLIGVGEYELRYGHASEAVAGATGVEEVESVEAVKPPAGSGGRRREVVVAREGHGGGVGGVCPSCEGSLPANAKICVGCGIKVDSGRPVLISAGPDENHIHANAETWIKLASLFMWVTPLPIPLASEAYGKHKPWGIRGIAIATVLASLTFFLTALGGSDRETPGKDFLLWPPAGVGLTLPDGEMSAAEKQQLVQQVTKDKDARKAYLALKEELREEGVPESEVEEAANDALIKALSELKSNRGTFHWYQMITHAFLHDYSSILGFVTHLGGNMLFMMVFGTRVNALLGTVATLIIYPVLAVGAAGVYLMLGHPQGAMLGASGAINGLAGMYLILFPVHRVYCGMWIRIRWNTWIKVFALRGFWVLLIYFAYDAAMVLLDVHSGTAHWAHIGGFLIGVVIALGLLASRQIYCGGADLLSVSLGKHAWPLIGKPARWAGVVG